jgi:hypothetical protein
MKDPIDYSDPRFEGMSKKKIKKLLKTEKYEANKQVWKKTKRDQKKQRRQEARLAKESEAQPEDKPEPEEKIEEGKKELKLKKRDFRKLVAEKTTNAPIVIVDAAFEDELDPRVF